MTEQFLGYTQDFIANDGEQFGTAMDEVVKLWQSNRRGGPVKNPLTLYEYLIDNEQPHTLAANNHTVRLAVFIDNDQEPPRLRAAVKIEPDEYTSEELKDIITAPGDNMSDGDHALLEKLESGDI